MTKLDLLLQQAEVRARRALIGTREQFRRCLYDPRRRQGDRRRCSLARRRREGDHARPGPCTDARRHSRVGDRPRAMTPGRRSVILQ